VLPDTMSGGLCIKIKSALNPQKRDSSQRKSVVTVAVMAAITAYMMETEKHVFLRNETGSGAWGRSGRLSSVRCFGTTWRKRI
jgi:hypothetical protein